MRDFGKSSKRGVEKARTLPPSSLPNPAELQAEERVLGDGGGRLAFLIEIRERIICAGVFCLHSENGTGYCFKHSEREAARQRV